MESARNTKRCRGRSDIQRMLDRELRRLERLLGINDGLSVVWIPNGSDKLRGEIRGKVVFIYEHSYESALETLRHELVDYLVCKAIEPYKEMLNKLILAFNEKTYQEKEEIVERIARLIDAAAN